MIQRQCNFKPYRVYFTLNFRMPFILNFNFILKYIFLAFVQKAKSATDRRNYYLADKREKNQLNYPLNRQSDLSVK